MVAIESSGCILSSQKIIFGLFNLISAISFLENIFVYNSSSELSFSFFP